VESLLYTDGTPHGSRAGKMQAGRPLLEGRADYDCRMEDGRTLGGAGPLETPT
jgi:hypothetical protein